VGSHLCVLWFHELEVYVLLRGVDRGQTTRKVLPRGRSARHAAFAPSGRTLTDRRRSPDSNGIMMEKIFPKNEHPMERIARVAIGLGLLSLVFVGPKTSWGFLGLMPIATGLLGSCPAYTLLGISTCGLKKKATATE
jgi:hypothetical protein